MIESLLKRRSCRSFTPACVEKEKQEKLIQAMQLSPSGKNIRPWEFLFIEDKQILAQLGNCREPKQTFLPDTPLAVVMMADTRKSDTWIEDVSIASILFQLEAQQLGLGSCWVQIRNRMSNQGISSDEFVRKLLGIPEDMAVLAIMAAGYPAQTPPAHTLDEAEPEKVHYEKF